MWLRVLDAREDLARGEHQPIPYKKVRAEGRRGVFTLTEAMRRIWSARTGRCRTSTPAASSVTARSSSRRPTNSSSSQADPWAGSLQRGPRSV